MQNVQVGYQSERDVRGWTSRHDAGEVPGRWPYGFDFLERPGIKAKWVELPNERPLVRLAAQAVEQIPTFRPSRGLKHDVLLTWDESAAVRAIGRRRGLTHYSGVIWMTDLSSSRVGSTLRNALSRASGLWVLSRAQIQPLQEMLGEDCPPVFFVRFGIDTDFYRSAVYPDRPLIVSAGGDRDRDHKTLFEAFELVLQAIPGVEILVQSSGVVSPPVGVKTFSSIPHTQLRSLYERMTVMVLATRPNLHVSGMTVALESMAVARPCVITDSPGMSDYVVDGQGGVVSTRDPRALADRVIELLRDVDAARRLGELGSARVRSLHTQETMANQFAQLVTSGTVDLSE